MCFSPKFWARKLWFDLYIYSKSICKEMLWWLWLDLIFSRFSCQIYSQPHTLFRLCIHYFLYQHGFYNSKRPKPSLNFSKNLWKNCRSLFPQDFLLQHVSCTKARNEERFTFSSKIASTLLRREIQNSKRFTFSSFIFVPLLFSPRHPIKKDSLFPQDFLLPP